jgi:peptidoglycan/LPS O-acetylase OafA/YrhL
MGAQFTIIVPAWTLSIELLFYAVAPFLLRRHVLLIAALAYVSYRLRWDGYHFGYYSEASNYRFFPFELSLFLYGAICFRLGNKFLVPRSRNWSTAITIGTLLVIIVIFMPKYFREDQYQLYAIIGILLPALFDFSRRSGWDRSLGDLSYPLYLVHVPVIAIVAPLAGGITSAGTTAYPVIAVTIAVALAKFIDRYLVSPVDRWRQLRVKRPVIETSSELPASAAA